MIFGFTGIKIVLKHQDRAGKTIKDFKAFTETDDAFKKDIKALGEVRIFAKNRK